MKELYSFDDPEAAADLGSMPFPEVARLRAIFGTADMSEDLDACTGMAADMATELEQAGTPLAYHRGVWYMHGRSGWRVEDERQVRLMEADWLRQQGQLLYPALTGSVHSALCLQCALPQDMRQPMWLDRKGVLDASGWVAADNCLLDLNRLGGPGETRGTLPSVRMPSPSLFTARHVNAPYDPEATCPKWLRFLAETQPRAETRMLLRMLAGLCLLPDSPIEGFGLLVNGPSGQGSGRRVFAGVVGALVNTGDMTFDPVDSRRPLISDMFVDTHRLSVAGVSRRAMERDRERGRIRVVAFGERIHSPNTHLHAEIVTEELPGVLNWAMGGLAAVLRLGRLPTEAELAAGGLPRTAVRSCFAEDLARLGQAAPRDTQVGRRMTMGDMEALSVFLEEACVLGGSEDMEPVARAMESYRAWSAAAGRRPLDYIAFLHGLAEMGIHKTRVRLDGKVTAVLPGLRLAGPGQAAMRSSGLGRFMADNCRLDDAEAREPGSEVYDAYVAWCMARVLEPVDYRMFLAAMVESGVRKQYTRLNKRNGVELFGLRLEGRLPGLEAYMEARCDLLEGAMAMRSALVEDYEAWCADNGRTVEPSTRLMAHLDALGVVRSRNSGRGVVLHGVCLKEEQASGVA